jgi:hypothetical protein
VALTKSPSVADDRVVSANRTLPRQQLQRDHAGSVLSGFPGAARQVSDFDRRRQYPQWGPGGRELFYVSLDFKLMAVSLKLGADSVEPSAPRELFPLPIVDSGWSPYETAADGQRFLVRAVPQQQASQPLTVIVNWPALLKKGAAAQ